MPKDFMPELPPEQRLQLLKDSCDDSEERTYYRELTQNELDIKREELTENLIELAKLDDQLDEAKAAYKHASKPIKEENKLLLNEVKTRRSEVRGMIFHMANYDEGVMETYDEEGRFVSSRRLKPEERQRKMFPISKAANE